MANLESKMAISDPNLAQLSHFEPPKLAILDPNMAILGPNMVILNHQLGCIGNPTGSF